MSTFLRVALLVLAGCWGARAELTVYYLRHGQGGHNITEAYVRTNIPPAQWPDWLGRVGNPDVFTPQGEAQVQALAGGLQPFRFDVIACSPLWRTRNTILPYLKAAGRTAEIWPELVEWPFLADIASAASGTAVFEGTEGIALPEAERPFFRFREDGSGTRLLLATNAAQAGALTVRVEELLRSRFGTNDASVLLVGHGTAGLCLARHLTRNPAAPERAMGNARLWRADRSTDGSCALRYYNQTPAPAAPKPLPSRIAFGSCAHQDKPQPVLGAVLERKADLFVYLGDNIYGDTRDMDVLRAKYRRLGSKPEFEALRGSVPLLAVWDDHDYGENDAGREYPRKEESKAIFMDFWNVPPDSPRRTHTGIYGAHRYEQDGRALQVILLDTRTFRDPLARRPREGGKPGWKNDYRPESDPARTLLGAEQWAWLEDRLREPADLRILCSSIQFGHEYNGFESWTNLPREQERMIDTIRRTRANGVVFISGDVHWGEISKREIPGGYPLYDVTASGITEDWPDLEGNRHRVGEAVRENHFGMIKIDWAAAPSPVLWLRLVDGKNTVRIEERVELSALRFAEAP